MISGKHSECPALLLESGERVGRCRKFYGPTKISRSDFFLTTYNLQLLSGLFSGATCRTGRSRRLTHGQFGFHENLVGKFGRPLKTIQ